MGRIKLEELSDTIKANINVLIPKINELLERFGEYRKITSGYRSAEDQARINPKASKSAHLTGEAVDLYDSKGELKAWLLNNVSILEELGLYCEAFEATPSWAHIQTRKPKSGSRFFKP